MEKASSLSPSSTRRASADEVAQQGQAAPLSPSRLSMGGGRGRGRGLPASALSASLSSLNSSLPPSASSSSSSFSSSTYPDSSSDLRETVQQLQVQIPAMKSEISELRALVLALQAEISSLKEQKGSKQMSSDIHPEDFADWLLEHDLEHISDVLVANGVRSSAQLNKGYASDEPTDICFLVEDFGAVLSKADLRSLWNAINGI